MNFLKNIFSSVKGFFNWERIITYGAIAALVVALLSINTCKNKKITETQEQCEDIANELLIGVVDSLNFEHSQIIDNMPEGDTIRVPVEVIKTVYKRTRTFVKNLKELNELKEKHAELETAHAQTLEQLETVKGDSLDPLGEWFNTIAETPEPLPIIETIKRDSGEQYQFTAKIHSRGQLEAYEHDIKVYPRTITLTKKEVETLRRKNFLAFKGGIIYYDSRNHHYPFSLQYGRSLFTVEVGPVFNKDFNVSGWQAQGGIVIKFK